MKINENIRNQLTASFTKMPCCVMENKTINMCMSLRGRGESHKRNMYSSHDYCVLMILLFYSDSNKLIRFRLNYYI